MSRCSNIFRTTLFLALTLVLAIGAAPTAFGQSCPTSAVAGNFTITFDGVTNNADGTSKWCYTVVWNGTPPNLSHFTVGLCPDLTSANLVSCSPSNCVVGQDPSTGLYGIKWDMGGGLQANTPFQFCFTLDKQYLPETGQVAAKAGPGASFGTLCVPSCTVCEVSITCPPDATIDCTASTDPSNTGVPTVTGNCPPHNVTFSDAVTPGACPQEYSITRTWTVTNSAGQTASCVQTITVEDNTAPVISGVGGPQTIECPAVPVFSEPTAADACDPNPSLTFNDVRTEGACPQEYSITRTWTAADACGNSSSASQTITVEDNTAPVISGVGGPQTIECPAVPVFSEPTASDACDPNPSLTFNDVRTEGACPQEYSITRTWTAVDACGNSSSASQTITVEDNTAPVISGVPQGGDLGCNPVPPSCDPNVTATDNCDPDVPVICTPGAIIEDGCFRSQTFTYSVTDDCGNSASQSATYTWKVDTEAPALSGVPGDASFQCYADVPPPAAVTANDNCDGAVNVSFSESESNPGSSCNNVITRTWSAVDECGNRISATQVITVNDNTAPVLSGVPSGGDLGCNPTPPSCDAGVTANDNCDGAVDVVCTPGSIVEDGCFRRQSFTYSASDRCGNSSSETVTYTWKVDLTAPVISNLPTGGDLGCNPTPPSCDPNVTANDNCDGAVAVNCDAGTIIEDGCFRSQTFTYWAVDACGNRASQDVTYTWKVDTEPPVLANCPSNIAVCDGSPVEFTPPTANDNCDGARPVTCLRSDGQGLDDPYPVGAIVTVTCSASDACGNSASCSFTVTVNENPACAISDGPGFGSPVCAGSGVAIANLFCGPDGMASYSWSVTCGTIDGPGDQQCVSWIPPATGGSCTFTLTIVDGNGCRATCTREVSVPNPAPCGPLSPPDPLPFCGSTGNSYCVGAGFTITNVTVDCADWSVTGWSGNCFTYNAGSSAGHCTFVITADDPNGCQTTCDVSFGCQENLEGCTPGFWKTHTSLWDATSDAVSQCVASAIAGLGAPYSGNGTTGSLFGNTFGLSALEMSQVGLAANLTLQQAINLGGGGFKKLARHAVAGLLSSCTVNYSLSATQVLTQVHDAFVNLQAEPLATQLDLFNNEDCPLDASAFAVAAKPVFGESEAEAVEGMAAGPLPKDFGLRGSYPNPFNASTQINFALPQAGTVRLVIYNILGQPVRTLLDGEQPAGERSVLWNGTDGSGRSVSSGVYFYKVTFNGQVKVGRMNLLK